MNPASALYEILTSVGTKELILPLAWSEVLEAEYGTPDFVRRHAEVFHLVGECFRLAEGMSEQRRLRSLKYAPSWWTALVAPGENWHATQAREYMPAPEVHQLALLGDVIEDTFPATPVTPDEAQLGGLKDDCQRWLDDLDGFTTLPAGTRRLLQADLRHLLWLIEHVDVYGASRVAHEAQAVTTSVLMSGPQVTDPAQRKDWHGRAQKWVVTVAAFLLSTSAALTPALYGTSLMLEQANNVVDQVGDLADGPEPPKELAEPPQAGADAATQ